MRLEDRGDQRRSECLTRGGVAGSNRSSRIGREWHEWREAAGDLAKQPIAGIEQGELGKRIERRIAAIDAAMVSLPESLRPEDGWDYQALVSVNGVSVGDGDSWVNHAEPFDEHCEGRDAQVVYAVPAADGELVALAYYKWGYWNVNLRWRETTDSSPVATHASEESASATEPVDMEDALQRLQDRFGPNR
ncbi:hypothetical protein IT415_01755 [bacterium]|nr:hypothetical protein [bacterium]